MTSDTWWSFGIGAVAASAVSEVSGNPLVGAVVGVGAMLGAAAGFDRQSRRRIARGVCESCGEPAAVELSDRSLWCVQCHAAAIRLGYAQGETDG